MKFHKYDANGNDFILLDIREHDPRLSQEEVAYLCHRRYGIGADGLMTLGNADGYDFEMRYYNSDGALGSMCGNGGRCITAFAYRLGVVASQGDGYRFLGYDGPHDGRLLSWDETTARGMVALGMRDIDAIAPVADGWYLDTGSPHFVLPVQGLKGYDVVAEGRKWRHRADLFPQGTNVDFIEPQPDGTLFVRTYERGVEDETYSCGTGVTASALVYAKQLQLSPETPQGVKVHTLGGNFEVQLVCTPHGFRSVCLTGAVSLNFEGEIDYKNKCKSSI